MITDEEMRRIEQDRRDLEEFKRENAPNEAARVKRWEDFKAKIPLMKEESAAMEREAVALYKQYGFFLPGPAKAFFRKLAIHLKWQDLLKVTQ